jgi:MYXO-CTERM domain-containing protein
MDVRPRRRALVFSLSLMVAGLWLAPTADACSCHRPRHSPRLAVVYAYHGADTVFYGRVIRTAPPYPEDLDDDELGTPSVAYEFEVIEAYKGAAEPGGLVRVLASGQPGLCGMSYEPGEWLVYARRDDNGDLTDARCSRSMPAGRKARHDRKYLAQITGDPDGPPPLPSAGCSVADRGHAKGLPTLLVLALAVARRRSR